MASQTNIIGPSMRLVLLAMHSSAPDTSLAHSYMYSMLKSPVCNHTPSSSEENFTTLYDSLFLVRWCKLCCGVYHLLFHTFPRLHYTATPDAKCTPVVVHRLASVAGSADQKHLTVLATLLQDGVCLATRCADPGASWTQG